MRATSITLDHIGFPQLPNLGDRPSLTPEEYDARMSELFRRSETDAVVVYGDREHAANLVFCCGFDPRFEEALLVITRDKRALLVGNEGLGYTALLPTALDVIHTPSLSLLGQSRQTGISLRAALSEAGLRPGTRTGIVGWKYFDNDELALETPTFAVPAFVLDTVRAASRGELVDRTPLLMAPVDGMRATNSADHIAWLEWGATRASMTIARILQAAVPGAREEEAVGAAGYSGDPLTAHVMFASGPGVAVGLRSPGGRVLEDGECATTAVGYWGGLCCRAAMIASADDISKEHVAEFLNHMAIPYWSTVAHWYELIAIGVAGGTVDAEVRTVMAEAGLSPALNPGHLTGVDEWINSPIRPGATDELRSGMVLQCDIIPSNGRPGWAANCEDTVALADDALQQELRQRHPETWQRIDHRRTFMHDALAIELQQDVLPLSAFNAYFPPLWRSLDHALTAR